MINSSDIMNKTLLVALFAIALCTAEPPIQRGRIVRFPGSVHHTQNLNFAAHLEAAPANAPYPPAGEKPEVPFELPTEEAENFQPDLTYGPPDQTYGPPDETYGPPDQTFDPPAENYPAPETEAIDSLQFFPSTELTLPLSERLTVFRPAAAFRPAKLVRPIIPQQLIPQSMLTLPKFERLSAFRPQPLVRRRPPTAAVRPAKLRRPIRQRARLAKLQVNKQNRPFAQLQPHIRRAVFQPNSNTIAFSERLQRW